MLNGKKILIGITGSIAAYKIPLLIRLLVKEGAEVKIVMTESAKDFVTPLTLSTLSDNPVYSSFFDSDDGTWHSHIDLGHWADAYVIAPVSATTMGKMSNGIADNLLVATYLAAKCPVFFAPAMDVDMYNHPSTFENIDKLKSFGNVLIEPATGELASGLTGAGRMQEPENILDVLKSYFQKKKSFNGLKVLVSAGPTYEPIDPVRFIGNYSSGKMGFAIAEAFAEKGATVTLVAGPVNLKIPGNNIEIIRVKTAEEMYNHCIHQFKTADIAVMAAAVADYTPEIVADKKIKKKDGALSVSLKPTLDILKEMGNKKRKDQFLVGFALETDNEIKNAKQKLKNKNLDLIVLNSLKEDGAGFDHDTNKIHILDVKGKISEYPLKDKKQVAIDIIDKITEYFNFSKGD